MKSAIYMERGKTQIVLTPENDWEIMALKDLGLGQSITSIHRGQFYQCVGGWIRHGSETDSVMLSITSKPNDNE